MSETKRDFKVNWSLPGNSPYIMTLFSAKLMRSSMAICALALVSACGEIQFAGNPNFLARRSDFSPEEKFEMFRAGVNDEIKRELAGLKPRWGSTWNVYWQDRYDLLRVNIIEYDPEEQRYIDYLHQLRHQLRLPLYDNEKRPTKYLGDR